MKKSVGRIFFLQAINILKLISKSHTTTLIVGDNGTGKSTVLDALTFSCSVKPFRKINKSQLINSTNEKDCSVEVEFSIGDN